MGAKGLQPLLTQQFSKIISVVLLPRGTKEVLNHLPYLFAFVLGWRFLPGLIWIYCSPQIDWSLHSL